MNSMAWTIARKRWWILVVFAVGGVVAGYFLDGSIERQHEASVSLLPKIPGLATLQVLDVSLNGDDLLAELDSVVRSVAPDGELSFEIDIPTMLLVVRAPIAQEVRQAADLVGAAATEALTTAARSEPEADVQALELRIAEFDSDIAAASSRVEDLLQVKVGADAAKAINPTEELLARALQLDDELAQARRGRDILVSNSGSLRLDLERSRTRLAEFDPPVTLAASADTASQVGYSRAALLYMGLVVGAALGAAFIYLEDLLRGKFHSEHQLERMLELHIVARAVSSTGRVFLIDDLFSGGDLTVGVVAPADASADVAAVATALEELAGEGHGHATFRGIRISAADRVSGDFDRLLLTVRPTRTRRRAATRAATNARRTGIPISGIVIQHE